MTRNVINEASAAHARDVDFPLRNLLVGVQWGAIAAVILVVAVAVGSIWLPENARTTLAAWGGPFGALVAVAIAAVTARRDAAVAARRARAEESEREIQQARLLTVEVTWSGWDDPEHSNEYDLEVKVTNHSTELILDPRLVGFVPAGDGVEVRWEIAEVAEWGEYPGPSLLVQPGKSEAVLVSLPDGADHAMSSGGKPKAVVAFTDEAGRRWRRAGSDRPVRVVPDRVSVSTAETSARSVPAGGPIWYQIDR